MIPTRIDPRSEPFQQNRAGMLERLAEIDELLAQARAGGGEKYVERHRERGKLLPRERIELLLDRDAPFLELSPLAALGHRLRGRRQRRRPASASCRGVECVIIANDPTVRGGAINPFTLEKTLRAMEIARAEPAAADQPGRVGRAPTCRGRRRSSCPAARSSATSRSCSAARIPTIALVFGNSTAGGAYLPGMCDYVVMVQRAAPRCSSAARRW